MPFNLSSTAERHGPALRNFRVAAGSADPFTAQVHLQSPAFGPARPEGYRTEAGGMSIPLGQLGIVFSVSAPQARGPLASAITIGSGAAEPHRTKSIRIDLDGWTAAEEALRAAQPSGEAEPAPRRQSSDPVVRRLSGALEAAETSPDPFGDVYADAVRLAIMARLLALHADAETVRTEQPAPARTALPKWRLKRVVEYIDTHLDETISLADMASVVGLSRMHFAAQFRAATGIRPHEFLLRRRIDRAKQMLAETETSLVEVALSVGFQTQAHFTTVFKRFVGVTPHRWRTRSRSEERDVRQDDRNIWVDPAREAGASLHRRAA